MNDFLDILKAWFYRKYQIHTKSPARFPKRGEIWYVDLGINIGSEINETRPCVIINNPVKNERTCLIIPASNTNRKNFVVKIENFQFLIHQIRCIDTKRLKRFVKRLTKNETDRIIDQLNEQILNKRFFR
jgi:mRNA-degrading endonuclease toxin of MazEF toxin-antitoxin module